MNLTEIITGGIVLVIYQIFRHADATAIKWIFGIGGGLLAFVAVITLLDAWVFLLWCLCGMAVCGFLYSLISDAVESGVRNARS